MSLSMDNGIVRIWGGRGVIGAGCLIGDSLVLTCAHVAAEALDRRLSETIELPSGEILVDFPLVAFGYKIKGVVDFWDFAHDIAGIRLVGKLPQDAERVQFCESGDEWLWDGHQFKVFGFPKNYDGGQWTNGRLGNRIGKGLIQIEGSREYGYSIQPGYSGGPVWDHHLKAVIGIIVSADGDPETNVGYIIPVKLLRKYWYPFPGVMTDRFFTAPRAKSYFVGRTEEMDAIVRTIVDDHVQIVGLVGLGGVGKTALAEALASQLASAFPEGALWKNIANSDVDAIINDWLMLLGYDFDERASLEMRSGELKKILSGRRILLVLDDVRDAQTALLLIPSSASPGLVILMTSRDDELIHEIGSHFAEFDLKCKSFLIRPMPVDHAKTLLERIAKGKTIGEQSAKEICNLVGGLPLAVEIAAQLLRGTDLSPEELIQLLSDKQSALEALQDDHGGIRTSFEASWQSLNKDEKRTYGYIGLFEGRRFTEAVLTAIAQENPLRINLRLRKFTARSLLFVFDTNRKQFQQHPLLADFIAEKMEVDTAARLRLANHYLSFLRQNQKNFDVLEDDWLNLMAAFDIFEAQGQSPQILEFAGLISEALFARGHLKDSRRIWESALREAERNNDLQTAALYEFKLGRLCYQSDEFEESIRLLNNSIEHNQGDKFMEAQGRYYLAFNFYSISENGKATESVRAARESFKELKEEVWFAKALSLEGSYGIYDEDIKPSGRLLQKALTLQRKLDDSIGCVRTLTMLARHAIEEKQRCGNMQFVDEAEKYTLEALNISKKINDWYERPYVLDTLALVYYNRGDWEASRQYVLQGLQSLAYEGPSQDRAQMLLRLCWIADEVGNYSEAISYAQVSFRMCDTLGDRRGMAHVLIDMGVVYTKAGNISSARDSFQRSKAILHELGDTVVLKSLEDKIANLES